MYGLGLKSLSFNVVVTFSRQVGAGLLGLVAAAMIARIYGPEGNGTFAVALLLPSLLSTLLNLGISPANVYFLGSSQVTVREVVRASLRICLWLTIIGSMIGVSILIWMSEEFFPGVSSELLWLALPIYPIALLSGFFISIFQGLQDFRTYNRIMIMQPILLLIALLAIAFFEVKSLELLIGVQILTNLIVLMVVAISVKGIYFASNNDEVLTGNYSKRAIGYGWKANVGSMLSFLNYKVDIFLVNFFMSPISTGIYVVSVTLAEKLWVVSSAVSTVLLPRLSQLSSDEDTRRRLTPLISRLVFIATFIGSLVLAFIAHYMILLMFGSQYLDGVEPLLILLPGIVILSAAKVWANDLAARGRPEINMYASLLTLVVNIIGNVTLIPQYGLVGAAVATTISYFVCSGITLVFYIRITSVSWMDAIFVRFEDVKMLMKMLGK